jgi:hypothetical protein
MSDGAKARRVFRSRSGIAMALVIGLLMLLSAIAFLLGRLSSQAKNELDLVSAHLRASAVGEAAYAEITARLSATPWLKRWFRDGPDIQYGQKAAGGTYSYMLRDAEQAPDGSAVAAEMVASAHHVDLLVRATYERSSVTMYWRITIPEDSLDSFVRVAPLMFQYAPDDTQPRARDMDSLTRRVEDQVRDRSQNTTTYEQLRPRLATAGGVPGVAQVLGAPGVPGIVDEVAPASGGAPVNSAQYLPQAGASVPEIPAPPSPAPPDSPTSGVGIPVAVTGGAGSDSSSGEPVTSSSVTRMRLAAGAPPEQDPRVRVGTLDSGFIGMIDQARRSDPPQYRRAALYQRILDGLRRAFGPGQSSGRGMTPEQRQAVTRAEQYFVDTNRYPSAPQLNFNRPRNGSPVRTGGRSGSPGNSRTSSQRGDGRPWQGRNGWNRDGRGPDRGYTRDGRGSGYRGSGRGGNDGGSPTRSQGGPRTGGQRGSRR